MLHRNGYKVKRNLFRLKLVCSSGVPHKITNKFSTVKIIKNNISDTFFEGYLIFHSKKARDWTYKYLTNLYNDTAFSIYFVKKPEV